MRPVRGLAAAGAGAAALCVCLGLAGAVRAQAAGGYTEAQAARGVRTFNANCSMCHGETLAGGPGTPPLAGPEFMFGWKAKDAADLFAYVKANMPPGTAGSLSDREYADVVAVLLKANGHAAGNAELGTDPAAQKGVRIGS